MAQAHCSNSGKTLNRHQVVTLSNLLVWAVSFVLVFPMTVAARIQGSAHDFTSYNWFEGDACAVCHLSYTSSASDGVAPIWNHTVSNADYEVYRSSTLSQSTDQPDFENISRLCLSCHDGTVALDSFGGGLGQRYIAKSRSLGTDLGNDHPVGVKPVQPGAAAVIGRVNSVQYYDGKVECPSCHDVHNNQVADDKLLRVERMGSALCFQCHEK